MECKGCELGGTSMGAEPLAVHRTGRYLLIFAGAFALLMSVTLPLHGACPDGTLDGSEECDDNNTAVDGCPDPDNDRDGIPDVDDKAPLAPEDMDDFQDTDGRPDPDNDQDGMPDTIDECPDEAEDMDSFEDEDGCPEPGG